jgi:hypothetical protein
MLPAVAVIIAGCVVATEDAVAMNAALVAFAGTVTLAGRATAVLLLAMLTTKPPLDAAVLKVTVHVSEPAPVSDELVQERELSVAGTGVPVPLSPIAVDVPLEELLLIVN